MSESPGESLLRLRLTRMGLDVREQVCIHEAPGTPRVDFLVGHRVVIEFDGRSKYTLQGDPTEAWWREKRRHDDIAECGYEILRVVWAELWDEPRLSVRVNKALRRASARRAA
jgi:very-short-patch-repair endonuclease